MIAWHCIVMLLSCGLLAEAQQPEETATLGSYKLEFYSDMKNANDAKSDCEARDAWLVEIKDKEIQVAVQNIIEGNNVWIGISNDDKEKWNDGKKVRFANWASASVASSSYFAVMASSGGWSTHLWSNHYGYVCQSDLTYMGSLNLTFHSVVKTFEDANNSCQALGSKLVGIKTAGLQTFITKKLKYQSGFYWTSGNDIAEEGEWKWGDQTRFYANDSNWEKNEPTSNAKENCLAVYSPSGTWHDKKCSSGYRYVCQNDLSSGDCGQETCSNKGTCSISGHRYNCTCIEGYFGTKCEKDLLEISAPQLEYVIYKGTDASITVDVKSYDGDVNLALSRDVSGPTLETKVARVGSDGLRVRVTFSMGYPSENVTYYVRATPTTSPTSYSRSINATVYVSDGCAPSPCKNGGICTNSASSPYYFCSCKPAYQGQHCQETKFITTGNCKYHVNFDDKISLADANNTCKSLGGVLAIIKTVDKQSLLERHAKSLYGNKGEITFWIGGYKHGSQWIWQDGTVIGADGTFVRWAPNYPKLNGIGIVITSFVAIGGDRSLSWSQLDWTNAGENRPDTGFICEIRVSSSCWSNQCKNGGTCVETGCEARCQCKPGFGGKHCIDDYLILTPEKTDYTVNAGETVAFPVNITSLLGPVTVRVSKNGRALKTEKNINSGLVKFTVGPWFETGSTVNLEFLAYKEPEAGAFTRKTTIRVIVRLPPRPDYITTKFCGTDVTLNVSVSAEAVGLRHRIQIFLEESEVNNKDVTPKTAGEFEVDFKHLTALMKYTVKVIVCPTSCIQSLSYKATFTTPADIPQQPMRYLLVTKKYEENFCQLQWSSANVAVTKFQLIVQSHESSGNGTASETISVSGTTSSYQYDVVNGRNYSFVIQAHTCAGTGAVMAGIGQCSTILPSDESATAAAAVLGVFFALALAAIGAMIFVWFRKYRESGDENKRPEREKSVMRPYQTTFFDDANDKHTEGGYEIPIDFKNRKPEAKNEYESNLHYDNVEFDNSEFGDDYEKQQPTTEHHYENLNESKKPPTALKPTMPLKVDMKSAKSQLKPTPLKERPKIALKPVKRS